MRKGQSIIEVLVALGIFVISMTAGFFVFFGGQTASVDGSNVTLATDYAREGIDALRAIRNRNWSEVLLGVHGFFFNGSEWLLASSTSDSRDIFTRQVEIAKGENDNTKIATTTITWQADSQTKIISFVEHLTNWEEPSQSSCKSQTLTGNWAAPQTLASADIGAGNSGTDVVARSPYAYVSGVAADHKKDDIFVFNVSDPSSPTQVASLNIGADGINALFLKGDYLYAASGNNSKELIIFDVSTPSSITEAGSYNLSGNDDALAVTAFGDTVAIGRQDSASSEIAFLDVSSPSSPTLISEFASTNNGSINDLTYSNEYLYAAAGQGSEADVMIFNISNQSNPTYVSTYDIPGTSTDELSIFTLIKGGGTHLLVGTAEDELIAIGATTTSGMYERSRTGTGGNVNDIVCVLGNLAFLATDNGGKEFLIININNINDIQEYASLNYPQIGSGIDFDNNLVFMTARSNDALRIITSQ